MEIVVIHQDITAIEVDAVVSPSAASGATLEGPAARILERGGDQVSRALEPMWPLRIGEAVLTRGGALRSRYIIHAPTVPVPGQYPSLDDLKKATLAAVKCAEDNKLRSLANPDMGMNGDPGQRSRVARAMVSVLKGFDSSVLDRILLVDMNVEIVKAYETALAALAD